MHKPNELFSVGLRDGPGTSLTIGVVACVHHNPCIIADFVSADNGAEEADEHEEHTLSPSL
jgi:hypothetical protein